MKCYHGNKTVKVINTLLLHLFPNSFDVRSFALPLSTEATDEQMKTTIGNQVTVTHYANRSYIVNK